MSRSPPPGCWSAPMPIGRLTAIFLAALSLVMIASPLLLGSPVGAAITLLVWGAAAFAIVPPVQMRVMQVAHDAPGLASSISIGPSTSAMPSARPLAVR